MIVKKRFLNVILCFKKGFKSHYNMYGLVTKRNIDFKAFI